MLLVPSLDDLTLEPARPLAFASDPARPFQLPDLSVSEDTPLWQILVFWLALVINLGLFLLLLSPELRRQLLRHLIRFALGVLAFLLILKYRVLKLPEVLAPPAGDAQPGIALPPVPSDATAFHPPELAPWVSYVVTLIVLWAVFLILIAAYGFWKRHRTRRMTTLGTIAEIARTSLAELTAGRRWGDVVLEAYARMSEAVRLARGLERESSTTPREFAARLIQMGLPAASVEELTSLFESVRYGGRASDTRAGGRAAACLESILSACKAAA
jgi:hypothetical protein